MGPDAAVLASMSQDVSSSRRSVAVTFDQLAVKIYYEQARALVEGGVDLLLLETILLRHA